MTEQKIKVCVIEDELDVRKALVEVIISSNEMEVICEDAYVASGIETIIKYKPDLIFLDIKLFGGDAFMILDSLKERGFEIPPVVINTGFNEFDDARRIFNNYKYQVIEILKKPFWEDWEEKENNILKKYYKIIYNKNLSESNNRVLIKTKSKTLVVFVEDILVIRKADRQKGRSKLNVITKEDEYVVSSTLNTYQDFLPAYFIRVNRFEIVNAKYLTEYDHINKEIKIKGVKIPLNVGNSYKKSLMDYLNII